MCALLALILSEVIHKYCSKRCLFKVHAQSNCLYILHLPSPDPDPDPDPDPNSKPDPEPDAFAEVKGLITTTIKVANDSNTAVRIFCSLKSTPIKDTRRNCLFVYLQGNALIRVGV